MCKNIRGTSNYTLWPDSLNLDLYHRLMGKDLRLKVERFDDKNFTDVNAYNKLMLKREFYNRFKIYRHILIYQLDAWVFKDELLKWCSYNYAYIGAPWFSDDKPLTGLPHFMGIGNGGFSLRDVKKHLRILSKLSFVTSLAYLIPQFLKDIS